MLKTDEITAAENAFMEGREMKPEEIKKAKKIRLIKRQTVLIHHLIV